MKEMAIRAAMVMPEIGFAELPTWPQMREETVVKKKPKMMMRMPPRRLTPICGSMAMMIASTTDPNTVRLIGRSSSVRSLAATARPSRLARMSANPARNAETIVGSDRARAMIPALATAPAPM